MNPQFKILFNPGEMVCTTNTPFGTAAVAVEDARPAEFFCINPLNGSRKDVNVTALRNFLVEYDTGTIDEQLKLIKESGLPYSTLTTSGGKSVHAIVSLEYPVSTLEDYKKLAKRIYAKMPGADTANSNPSRLSRMAGVRRESTGQPQQLLDIRLGRISISEIMDWVGPEPEVSRVEPVNLPDGYRLPTIFTKHFLAFGSEPGRRNSDLFKAACDLTRCGYTEDQIIEMVQSVLDLTLAEIRHTVKSAARTTRGSK